MQIIFKVFKCMGKCDTLCPLYNDHGPQIFSSVFCIQFQNIKTSTHTIVLTFQDSSHKETVVDL